MVDPARISSDSCQGFRNDFLFLRMSCKGGRLQYGGIDVKCENGVVAASARIIVSATFSSAEFFQQTGITVGQN
jgi:hypothetical protein